ncbi:hypothetical protein [Rhodococcus sp. 14-2470-1a]|uniref:hypothetical protein n=1 Tax=Rhodococcus sp. 14-2470-1a TaxID=2023150 RepID=UPI000B9ACFEF|nr:hypothetical protein [Rhodococcus sp. 14-2470-1a]OZF47577.1 hypothetical protein CH292_19340 [Rhodococcus sp. 14-2470-1a]
MTKNAIEIITDNVLAEVSKRFEGAIAQLNAEVDTARSRGEALFDQWEAEGRARMDELFAGIPAGAVITEDGDFDPIGWIKTQAKSRALRTLLQGLVFAALTSAVTAVVQAVSSTGFDITDLSDWKLALTLGAGAFGTAVVGYLQNALGIKPPKV